ncbi:hypothetical protein D3C73_356590 [compost metagenome]
MRSGLSVGADPRPAIADHAVHRGFQFGIADVQLRQITLGLGLDQRGAGLLFLRGDHVQLPLCGKQFGLGTVALGLGGLERGVRSLGAFHRHGAGGNQAFVARIVIPRTGGFGPGGIDTGAGLADHRLLQLLGGVEIGEQGFFSRHRTFGLGQVGAVIARIQTNQHVASLDLLVVGHQHFVDVTGDFRPDHRHVAADVGVVGFLDETASRPPVRGVYANQHQSRDTQCRQEQAFEQGRFGGGHRGSQGRFNGGHAGHERVPVKLACYYGRNMTQVIYCCNWFVLPVVRSYFSQSPGVMPVMSLKNAMKALSLENPSSKALKPMFRPVVSSSMARIRRHCWRHC